MHVTRAAVGQKIKELSNQLGVKLFIPHTRGITPTSEANNLYPIIQNAIESIFQAESALHVFNSDSTGIIRIAIPNLAFKYYLGNYIKEYRTKHPKVLFEFFSTAPIELLEEGKIDFIFHFDRHFFDTNVKAINLVSAESVFVASKTFLQQHGLAQNLTREQLLKLPIISERVSWQEFMQKNDIETEPFVIKTESTEKAYIVAKASGGIGYYCKGLLETVNAGDTDMVYLNVEGINLPVMHEVCAFNKNLSRAARVFIEGLIKAMPKV